MTQEKIRKKNWKKKLRRDKTKHENWLINNNIKILINFSERHKPTAKITVYQWM